MYYIISYKRSPSGNNVTDSKNYKWNFNVKCFSDLILKKFSVYLNWAKSVLYPVSKYVGLF